MYVTTEKKGGRRDRVLVKRGTLGSNGPQVDELRTGDRRDLASVSNCALMTHHVPISELAHSFGPRELG